MNKYRVLNLLYIIVIVLLFISSCQISETPSEESSDFIGAIIRFDGRTYNMDTEKSYLLLYEILSAQEVEESEPVIGDRFLQINLFPDNHDGNYSQVNLDVFIKEQKYYVIDSEKKVTYVLHSYYTPTLNELIKMIDGAVIE